MRRRRRSIADWDGTKIPPGTGRDLELKVSESYSGMTVSIPLHVRRGLEDGPVLFVTAALHGDELNGTGAIRSLIRRRKLRPERGALILVPVVNVLAFDRHSRYLPDRRDLNRCFPGSGDGSLARRMAQVIFDEVVSRADFGIDLHTAAVRRTNYPTLRADMNDAEVRRLAEAFGPELILSGEGPPGALRRAACAAGCPTVVFEAGEVWKVEPSIVAYATRGVRNAMIGLGMIEGKPRRPARTVVIQKKRWVRAERGGFLRFHAIPGAVVKEGQPLATNTSLLGRSQNVLAAPFDGVIVGMTTLPAVSPGEGVYHIGRLSQAGGRIDRPWHKPSADDLRARLVDDLASNVLVVDPPEPPADDDGTD